MKNKEKLQKPRNFSVEVTIKGLIIVGMIVLLLIPYFLIMNLVDEREERKDDAVEAISEKWSRAQTIAGPLLQIPYTETAKAPNATQTTAKTLIVTPEQLDIRAVLEPETRKYGMFEAVLYRSTINITGTFSPLDLAAAQNLTARSLAASSKGTTPTLAHDPNNAIIALELSDLRGLSRQAVLTLDGTDYPADNTSPGDNIIFLPSGIDFSKPHTFSLTLDLKGSTNFSVIPFGKTTTVEISGAWGDPSFTGNFSPDYTPSKDSFAASWSVLDFNRNIPDMWIAEDHDEYNEPYSVYDTRFGVDLVTGADQYQQNERAVKYALLFIVLTFVVFFFVEVLTYKRIHPVQYLLVSAALMIFYTLLLSISEITGFGWAYLISSVGTVGLVTFYTAYIFKSRRETMLLSGILAMLYAYLYFILQMENYALLVGSVGLFIILGVIMFVSRKVNWYRSEVSATFPTPETAPENPTETDKSESL